MSYCTVLCAQYKKRRYGVAKFIAEGLPEHSGQKRPDWLIISLSGFYSDKETLDWMGMNKLISENKVWYNLLKVGGWENSFATIRI